MNLLLFPSQQDHYTIPSRDPRLEHVRGVLRLGLGDSFDVGAIGGPRGKATIQVIHADSVELAVRWGEMPAPPPPIDVILALPRPATARKILMDASTLGVRSLRFFPSEKSDPAFAASRLWSGDAWREALILGAEQAFTTHLPETRLSPDFASALEGASGRRVAPDVYEGTRSLSGMPFSRETAGVTLAIGPERGWGPRDRRALRTADFTLCRLGKRVLRVETALVVSLSLLLAKLGEL